MVSGRHGRNPCPCQRYSRRSLYGYGGRPYVVSIMHLFPIVILTIVRWDVHWAVLQRSEPECKLFKLSLFSFTEALSRIWDVVCCLCRYINHPYSTLLFTRYRPLPYWNQLGLLISMIWSAWHTNIHFFSPLFSSLAWPRNRCFFVTWWMLNEFNGPKPCLSTWAIEFRCLHNA